MSRTYVRNRKRNKTEWVSRPQAESQHAWGLEGGSKSGVVPLTRKGKSK